MKFTAVAAFLALAMGANASIIAPVVVGSHWPGAVVVGPAGPAAITVAASPPAVVAGPGPVQVVSGPAVVHAPAVVAAPVVVGGGTFVAKTRGAVHVAPLAGHTQSVVSANLQPAPGTI